MSKRAEAAMKAYPVDVIGHTIKLAVGAEPKPMDWNENNRKCYAEGYKQAEKDVWERIEKYLSERNPTDYATVGWILKNIEEYKNKIMEEE